MPNFTRWDYFVLQLPLNRPTDDMQAALKNLGEEGWELVTSFARNGAQVFVLKKPTE